MISSLGKVLKINPILTVHETINCTVEADTQAIESVIEKMFYAGATEQEAKDFIIANVSRYFTVYAKKKT